MTRWYRSYADKHRNLKIVSLTDREFRLWDQLLCIAAENEGNIPPLPTLCAVLRQRRDHVTRGVERMVELRLLEVAADGSYTPRDWHARQYTARPEKGEGYYTYLISTPDLSEIKIGYSKNPWARLKDLQSAHHKNLVIAGVIPCLESGDRWLSDMFKDCSLTGEWYKPNPKMLALINALSNKRIRDKDAVVAFVANYCSRSTTETDTEAEAEKTQPPADARGACDLFEEPPDGGYHPDGELHEQCSPSFESWWTQYPNKVGKRKAATEYDQALKRLKKSSGPQVHVQLLAALVAQCAVWKRKGIVGRYIPHPATWLHQSRYMDAEVQAEVARPRPALLADGARVDVVELTPAEPPPAKRETLEMAKVVGWMPSDASER